MNTLIDAEDMLMLCKKIAVAYNIYPASKYYVRRIGKNYEKDGKFYQELKITEK